MDYTIRNGQAIVACHGVNNLCATTGASLETYRIYIHFSRTRRTHVSPFYAWATGSSYLHYLALVACSERVPTEAVL